ncbi:MAG: pyridoxamine 5'-phosphate oxidase family protein [Candidatus Bathyarchaeia archaeon]|jgi:nitroimidazol reductase NimA-like FMN-containing flavoprotein (pyridoxamine 5'-phosphate oxidase superfamily)
MAEDSSFYQKVAMTNEEMTAYLGIARLARISTARNGVPHITPVWYLHDGSNFFVSTGTKTRMARDIKKNPNVSLTIDSSDGMFRHKCVIVNGLAQLSREGHPEVTRRIYQRYLGREGLEHPFAKQLLDDDQYVITIIPQKILTWDYTKLIKS